MEKRSKAGCFYPEDLVTSKGDRVILAVSGILPHINPGDIWVSTFTVYHFLFFSREFRSQTKNLDLQSCDS